MTRPMTHTRPMTPLFGVATLLLLCIASTGCTHPVLGRPALLGASVTSGAGAAVTAGVPFDTIPTEALARAQSSARDGSSVSVDAAVAFSAVVRAPHVVPLNLGNGGVFIDPDAALREQVDAAAAWNPSVIIAVDWLFWPVHQAISLDIPTEQRAARRLASVDAALADLDQFHCPIVIGDVPQMTRAHGGLLRAEHDPSSEVRAAANQRLTAWASARKNRFVLAVSQLADAMNAAEPFEVAGFKYARGESLRLVQRDGLHATPEGLVVLMAAAVECLCAHGLVDEEECRHEIADIALEMEREAIAAKDRSRPTLLESLSLSSMWDEFRERLDAKDDAGAAATLERVLNRLESFDRNPLGDDDDFISIAFSLSSLSMSFGQDPKTSAVYERHWRALSSDAKADAPHLWRFSLWLNYAQQLPESLQQETADALAARRESRGAFREPFAGIVWDDAQSIGDARTLARCFPEFDEAYAIAKERTASWLERTRTLKHDDPLRTVQLKLACEELFAINASRRVAGFPDKSAQLRTRARADGLGEVIDAADRYALIKSGTATFIPRTREHGPHGTFTTGNEVFSATRTHLASDATLDGTPELGPRVALPQLDRAFVPPNIGFGFVEGLDGAVAVINDKTCLTVITRADVDIDGSLRMVRGAALWPPTATCWQELGRLRVSRFESLGPTAARQTFAPIEVSSDADFTAFATAVRIAASSARIAGAPLGSPTDVKREVTWPAAVYAIGTVDRATIALPTGSLKTTGAPQWANFEIINERVILLGTLELGEDGDIATAALRLHAIWGAGSAEHRHTGEVIAMSGFRVGSASDLALAIADDASSGAEVRLSWRPQP